MAASDGNFFRALKVIGRQSTDQLAEGPPWCGCAK
jgi:hypothetical protein